MNKFFRVLSTTALAATLVSSGLQPITSYAEEQEPVINQENSVFVTPLAKNPSGVTNKSLISQPSAPVPDLVEIFKGFNAIEETLPPDTKGLQRGVTTISGSLLDYIPVDVYNDDLVAHLMTIIYPDYDLLNPNFSGDLFFGYIDNDGNYNSLISNLGNELPDKDGKIATLMLNPDVLPADDDSSIILDAYYERVYDSKVDYNGGTNEITDSKTAGITKEKSKEFSNTIGWSYGFEAGFGDVLTVSTELSQELTSSFGSSVAIENSHTVEYSHTFGERFDDPYAYNVYHLVGDYWLSPSSQLEKIIDSMTVMAFHPGTGDLKQEFFKLGGRVGETKFSYPTDDYRAIEIYENGVRIPEQNLLDQFSIEDFTNSNWSKNNIAIGYSSETTPDGDSAQKLTQTEVNGAVQQYVDLTSDGKNFTFGVWMKADEPHQAQLKIQNRNNTESTGVKVDVTTEWQYFSVITDQPFSTNDGVTVVLWPSAYNGPSDSVYVWEPKLIEE
ncbi:phage head spike fiber domain-containing protein [Cytobacillus sp. Hm23]